jgi:hypothetical protein
MQAARRIRGILLTNGNELLSHLGSVEDDPAVLMRVWDATRPEEMDRFLDEAERRLFNFVAAVHARVDFLRAADKRGHLRPPKPEYDAQVNKTFRSDPVHLWLVGLRNHMLHHRLPVAFSQLSVEMQEGTDVPVGSIRSARCTVLVDTADLLSEGDFPALAKDWMRQTAHVDLRQVVAQYCDGVATFDAWFDGAYMSGHGASGAFG